MRRETITQRKTGENLFVQVSAADWSVTGNKRSGNYLRKTKNLRAGRKKWRDKGRPVEKVIADDFILETRN